MTRKYYTLFERDPDGTWSPQFGDYHKKVVEQERRDLHESEPCPKLKDLRIIAHDDTLTIEGLRLEALRLQLEPPK